MVKKNKVKNIKLTKGHNSYFHYEKEKANIGCGISMKCPRNPLRWSIGKYMQQQRWLGMAQMQQYDLRSILDNLYCTRIWGITGSWVAAIAAMVALLKNDFFFFCFYPHFLCNIFFFTTMSRKPGRNCAVFQLLQQNWKTSTLERNLMRNPQALTSWRVPVSEITRFT